MKLVLMMCCLLSVGSVHAQNPPPLEIANTVSNLWFSNNLTNLTTYATNLYSNAATNYLPAVMVSVFYDRVFLGKLLTASNKLARVKAQIEIEPQNYTDKFRHYISVLDDMTVRSIIDSLGQQINPDAIPAEPQLIRSDMGSFVIPDIGVLYYTPAVSLQ